MIEEQAIMDIDQAAADPEPATSPPPLEKANPAVVAENFIDPRRLPNLMTELTDEKLPANARARFGRMLNRNKTRPVRRG